MPDQEVQGYVQVRVMLVVARLSVPWWSIHDGQCICAHRSVINRGPMVRHVCVPNDVPIRSSEGDGLLQTDTDKPMELRRMRF